MAVRGRPRAEDFSIADQQLRERVRLNGGDVRHGAISLFCPAQATAQAAPGQPCPPALRPYLFAGKRPSRKPVLDGQVRPAWAERSRLSVKLPLSVILTRRPCPGCRGCHPRRAAHFVRIGGTKLTDFRTCEPNVAGMRDAAPAAVVCQSGRRALDAKRFQDQGRVSQAAGKRSDVCFRSAVRRRASDLR